MNCEFRRASLISFKSQNQEAMIAKDNNHSEVINKGLKADRKLWIDQLRGIAMLLVIIGHKIPGYTAYFVWTSPVKIPLFFAVSGYLFNDRGGDSKQFFVGIWKKLIVPWILLSLLPLKVLKAFLIDRSFIDVAKYIWSFISGDSLWYMPCCIVAEIIWFYIIKFSKGRKLEVCFISFMCAAVGYGAANAGFLYFARTNTALIAQLFLCLGFLIRESESIIKSHTLTVSLACGFIYILMAGLTFWLFPNQNLDVHLNRYYNVFICFMIIYAGCIFIFTVAQKFNRTSHILVFVGQNTLVFYMLYSYCDKIVSRCFSWLLPENIVVSCCLLLLSCVLCAGIAELLNIFAPIVVGKRR